MKLNPPAAEALIGNIKPMIDKVINNLTNEFFIIVNPPYTIFVNNSLIMILSRTMFLLKRLLYIY
jgi:hypothetical protein